MIFEIVFLGFWIMVFCLNNFPMRNQLMAFFNVLMFANGIWHFTWFGIEKKYVPGIITAPFFILVFFIFYFKYISGLF